MFIVYAIYNRENKKIYIGQTEDINRRLIEHNDRNNSRHRYTNQFKGVWQLIYSEEVIDRSSALKREKQLKVFKEDFL